MRIGRVLRAAVIWSVPACALVWSLPAAASAPASRWSVERTPTPARPASSILSDVSCTSATACTAVGVSTNLIDYRHPRNAPLVERWNGRRWTIQKTPSPPKNTRLSGVSCISATVCTAVGSAIKPIHTEVPFIERWNGRRWTIEPSPPGQINEIENVLNAVSCSAANACTAVGFSFNTHPGHREKPLVERWNGRRWTIQHISGGSKDGVLNGVSCTSASACTAVGEPLTQRDGETLIERWNGQVWSRQRSPSFAESYATLASISCTSPRLCTAVGSRTVIPPSCYDSCAYSVRTLAERWDGTKWTIQHTTSIGDVGLTGVSCTSARACTAAGGPDGAERWNGSAWKLQHAVPRAGEPGALLTAVSCSSVSVCTAVGASHRHRSADPGGWTTLAERWQG